jgi:hypothetical protein
MYLLTIPQHFAHLRDISDTVENYISNELYIADFGPDNYTEKDILGQCYEIIIDELKDYGITTDLDYKGDYYLCGYLCLLREFVEKLPDLITKHLAEKLSSIIEESDNLLSSMIALFDHTEYKELTYISDNIYYDDEFVTYVKQLTESIQSEEATNYINPSDKSVQQYIEKIRVLRELAAKFSKRIVAFMPDNVDVTYLNKLIRDYDMDKISLDAISAYSKIDREEVPEYLRSMHERLMDEHHKRSLHHIEYWVSRNLSPSVTDLVILTAHHVEPGKTKSDVHNAVEEMITKGRSVLSDEQIDTIRKMRDVCLDGMQE